MKASVYVDSFLGSSVLPERLVGLSSDSFDAIVTSVPGRITKRNLPLTISALWDQLYRVAKPDAFLVAFNLTESYSSIGDSIYDSLWGEPLTATFPLRYFTGHLARKGVAPSRWDSESLALVNEFYMMCRAISNTRGKERRDSIVAMFERLVPVGGLVLDPFCDNGHIGEAAVMAGCDFVGINNNQRQAARACRRIMAVKGVEA